MVWRLRRIGRSSRQLARTGPRQSAGAGDAAVVRDSLVFAVGGRLIAVQVEALGERRGPAAEARTLYSALQNSSGAQAGPAH